MDSNLMENLNIDFQNKKLLEQALTHRSYLNEHPDVKGGHNERLEFLGDAVLEIVITEYLYNKYPDTPEGDLTNWRASLVNAKMLYQVASELGVENNLRLSKGEAKDKNTKARQYILANALEAIIGAIYLDQGLEVSRRFIISHLIPKLAYILSHELYLDPKSKFQELAQEKEGVTPVYKTLSEEGPDHEKTFTVGLYLGEELVAEGSGLSKQEAQVNAAELGLKNKGW